MHTPEKVWAAVAAGGCGARMQSARAKQYLQLAGRRVIDHALHALCESACIHGVVAGIRDGDAEWNAHPFAHEKFLGTSYGGKTRAHTVQNALQKLRELGAAKNDWVMVHDAARPCVPQRDIANLAAAARADGRGAALALKVTDALKRGGGDRLEESMARAVYWRALTPQMFRCGALQDALQRALECGRAPADECEAMQSMGARPLAVEGDAANIKITVPADLQWAERQLQMRDANR